MNDDGKTKEQLICELGELRRQLAGLKGIDEQNNRLRMALDHISASIYMKDLQSRYVYLNRHSLELFKRSAEELLGNDDHHFFPPDTVAKIIAMDKRVLEHGEDMAEEIESIFPDGSRRIHWNFKTPIYDAIDKGRILGLLGISTDITDRKLAEEELRRAYEELEVRVAERTTELAQANADLKAEILERMHTVKELEQSNERLRVAQELSLDAFTILTPVRNKNGTIVDFQWDYVNPAAGRILKYVPEDLVGRRLLDVLPGNQANSDLFARYVRVFETGEPHDYEVCYESEGILGWFRNMTVKLGDSIAVNFSDITERKRAEAALRDSEDRFKGLAESMTLLVWITDARGVSIYHNPRFEEYTGLKNATPEERWQLVHPDDMSMVQEAWLEYLRNGGDFQTRYRLRGKDGSYRWFLGRSTVMRDAGHRVVKIFDTATDIDDLIRTEAVLKDSLHILAEAERIGHTGSWKRELATNHIDWSPGMYRMFGIPNNEAISLEIFGSLIHPEDRSSLYGKLQETIRKGTPFTGEYRIVRPEGAVRILSGRVEATLDSTGKPTHIYGTAQDITERKWLEEGLINARKLESIGTLAAGIAHDYNNLLTSILGNMELAKMHLEKTDSSYAPLAKAQEAAMKAAVLTRKFTTFARGDHPAMKFLDVRKLLTQSVMLALSGSNIKAEWKIADELFRINADENQIGQVIHNIVMNVREAMPHGGILSVEAGDIRFNPENPQSLPAGPYVRMTFLDEGVGIPAENLPRVFDPYFTTKGMGAVKGMGLGLSICYSIIKRHGGHITVDSKVGVGTTVTIYIPAATEQ